MSRSTSAAGLALLAALGCGARSIPHGDGGGGIGETDGGREDGGPKDGSVMDAAPADAMTEGGILDASDVLSCFGNLRGCPTDRPFCCMPYGLEGPELCSSEPVGCCCSEAPPEDAVELDCRGGGIDCPEELPFCCTSLPTSYCVDHALLNSHCSLD